VKTWDTAVCARDPLGKEE